MKKIWILFAAIIFISGCAHIQREVKVYPNPDIELAKYKSFMVVPIGKSENPLLEKELLYMARDKLIKKGFICRDGSGLLLNGKNKNTKVKSGEIRSNPELDLYDPDGKIRAFLETFKEDESPDFLVAIFYYCVPFNQYIPPSTVYFPMLQGGQTGYFHGSSYGQVGGSQYTGTTHGYYTTPQHYEYLPYTTGGYTITLFHRNITIFFVDRKDITENNKLTVIWQAVADSNGRSSDIRKVAPTLFNDMFKKIKIHHK